MVYFSERKSAVSYSADLVRLHTDRLYVVLPPTPEYSSSRTFILLPKLYAPAAPHFVPAKNKLAPNEIQAHTSMFAPATNDGYYELGLDAAKIVQEALTRLEHRN